MNRYKLPSISAEAFKKKYMPSSEDPLKCLGCELPLPKDWECSLCLKCEDLMLEAKEIEQEYLTAMGEGVDYDD